MFLLESVSADARKRQCAQDGYSFCVMKIRFPGSDRDSEDLSVIDDDNLWPDQMNGAPPHKPPEKLPKMVNTSLLSEKPKSAGKAKGNRVEICESTGKRKWHRKQAAQEAKRLKRDKFAARVNSYPCKSCKSWHVGNSNQRKPKQRGR